MASTSSSKGSGRTPRRKASRRKTSKKPSGGPGVVLDTNVVISGIFWDGPSRKVLRAWSAGKFTLVTSEAILTELRRVLSDFKIRLPESDREELLKDMRAHGILVEPKTVIAICDDPDDDKFIEAAVAGKAQYIVSQDKHLLRVRTYEGIGILTPERFLQQNLYIRPA